MEVNFFVKNQHSFEADFLFTYTYRGMTILHTRAQRHCSVNFEAMQISAST